MNDVYSIFKVRRSSIGKYQKYISLLVRFPRFNRLIKAIGPLRYEVPIWGSLDDAVLYAVIGQMLSGGATFSIIRNLLNRFKQSSRVISWASRQKASGALYGISERKRRALMEWQVFYAKYGNQCREWAQVALEEYRKQVDSIWGFGRWSADMIGTLHLGRMDIWPETDSGISRASRIIFETALS